MSYMAAEFDAILREYGHDIYLNRRSQSSDGNVTYSDTFERHTVRHTMGNNRALPTTQQEYKEGIFSASERLYYFRAAAQPFDGDRIYEEDPRTENRQTVWFIDGVLPMRGLNGDIDYYVAGATRLDPS